MLFIFQQAPNANGPSIFDVTQRDADKYVVTPNQQFEEDEDISAHPLRGREYWMCIKVICWIGIFLYPLAILLHMSVYC